MNDVSGYVDSTVFDKTQFFYPTADYVYKNNGVVYVASAILDSKSINHTVTLTWRKEKSLDSVECVGRLPYEAVLVKYNSSTLIFPSYIETVGFPMLEARAMGSIVLASDCPFSKEVLKDYENAYFFDPFKPEQLVDLMERVVCGEITRKSEANKNIRMSNSWMRVLKEVITTCR